MTPELKAQWLFALRSGEYEQTVGQLQNGNAFCCLGVLCEVAGIPHNEFRCLPGQSGIDYGPLWEAIGKREVTLFNMNDDGSIFPEIADWIEVNIPTTNEENENVEK